MNEIWYEIVILVIESWDDCEHDRARWSEFRKTANGKPLLPRREKPLPTMFACLSSIPTRFQLDEIFQLCCQDISLSKIYWTCKYLLVQAGHSNIVAEDGFNSEPRIFALVIVSKMGTAAI
jgi:hypothetical protein